MGKVLDEDLVYEILSVVAEIPAGCVEKGEDPMEAARRIATAIIPATASSTTRDASRQTSPTSEHY